MKKEELMAFTLSHKNAVARTLIDLSCEALSMEPIGEILYGGSIGEGYDGGASLERVHGKVNLQSHGNEFFHRTVSRFFTVR